MLCPFQVESDQLYVPVSFFEASRAMIPQNERQAPAKELSLMDRMQQKLDALCEIEGVQGTRAYVEKQMTIVGTNMRKLCVDLVQEMLLPDSPQKLEGSQGESELGKNSSLHSGTDKLMKSTKSAKLIDAPIFNPEASISGSPLEDVSLHQIVDIQKDQEPTQEELPSMEAEALEAMEAPESATLENSALLPIVNEQYLQLNLPEGADDQYAQWFVSEEYRATKLGILTSSASLQSFDGMQRTLSNESLSDWELI